MYTTSRYGCGDVQGFCDGKDCQTFMVVPGEFGSRMIDPRDLQVQFCCQSCCDLQPMQSANLDLANQHSHLCQTPERMSCSAWSAYMVSCGQLSDCSS